MHMSDFVLVSALAQTQPEAPAAPAATQGAPRVPGSVGASGTAQQPLGPGPTGGGGGGGGGAGGFNMIWLLMIFLVVMVVMTSMTGRREKKRREAVMSALKKNDRVQTNSGIIGTIVELQDNEVVLRVDEVSNTRIRFARTAIQGVLREAKSPTNGGGGSEIEPKLKPHASAV